MSDFRFVRVHDRHLSLWQSAVAENVRARLGAQTTHQDVLADPMMQAANAHVEAALEHGPGPLFEVAPADPAFRQQYLSALGLQLGQALVERDGERAAALDVEFRKYSDDDPGFLTCATTYAYYYAEYDGTFMYNDWTVAGRGDINYGVVDWQIPSDGVVGIIGDWGTGLPDAQALLTDLMVRHNPVALIHLGDIYYSATPSEVVANYAQIIANVFQQTLPEGQRIPVFTLAGNHDYYSLGYAFYDVFQTMNGPIPGASQNASYFCLRTADGGWQFLGMDTGFYDSNPIDQVNPLYAGPQLHATEVQWLQNKITTFSGATILLSHHQLFSANARLNGRLSPYADLPYMNPYLREAFEPYFATDIAAWLWGHEHNFVAYQNDLFGLPKARLIGCSAYEELVSADPYKVNYPQVPYLDPTGYRVASEAGYYNHGYSIIDFSARSSPTDPVTISHYQFPSWGSTAPPSPASSLLLTEQLALPTPPPPVAATYGTSITMLAQEGVYIAAEYTQVEYYPTMSTDQPVALQITGGSGEIQHGDTVQILTTEQGVGGYNVLGAWSTPTLYYYTSGYSQQNWRVVKADPTDPVVNYGDQVAFVNLSYSGQYLQPYWSRLYGAIYLTTTSGDPYWWTLAAVAAAPAPFQTFVLETGTPIAEADGAADFGGWAMADYNVDGVPDLYGIKVANTGTGEVEVHVLDGADSDQSFLLQTPIPITEEDGAANFKSWCLGQFFDTDDVPDLFAIKVSGTQTGFVEVHVLSGASNYQSFLLQTPTPITQTDGAQDYAGWAMADFDGDGISDLYGIKVANTGTGNVELHVLSGASNYQSFILQTGIPIVEADGQANFAEWTLADFDGDGLPDLFGVKVSDTGSGAVEVHVLSGASGYQSFILETPIPIVESDGSQDFKGWATADLRGDGVIDLFGIKVANTGTGDVEVHALSGE
jgi:Calcineurin-like phosphoesterase